MKRTLGSMIVASSALGVGGLAVAQTLTLPDGTTVEVGTSFPAAVRTAMERATAGPPPTPAEPSETPKQIAEQHEEARLSKLREVTFDRTPEAILKAWAEVRKEAEKPDEAESDEAVADPEDDEAARDDAAEDTSEATGADESEGETETSSETTDAVDEAGEGESVEAVSKNGEAETDEKKSSESADPAAEAAEKAKEIADLKQKNTEDLEALDESLKTFRRDVTLSRWETLDETFTKLVDDEERKALYERLLNQLPDARGENRYGGNRQYAAKPLYEFADVLALAAAAPAERTDGQLRSLGRLVRLAVESGRDPQRFVALLGEDLARPEDERTFERAEGAVLLDAAGQLLAGSDLLPAASIVLGDQELTKDEVRTAAILSRFHLARYRRDTEKDDLETGWALLQRMLKAKEADDGQRRSAITRSLGLRDRIGEERADTWLADLFRERPALGVAAIETVGKNAVDGLKSSPQDTGGRRLALERLKRMATTLVGVNAELAAESGPVFDLIATAWIREADFSRQYDTTNYDGPRMQRDMYGNYYFNRSMMQMNRDRNMPRAVPAKELLEVRPEGDWTAEVDESLKPRLAALTARLFFKVGEAADGFPFVEEVAAVDAEEGRRLATEFLQAWTKKHDPNASQYERNPYIFYYGYEQRADGIPLTRSQQDRNLKDLAAWIGRIKQLPIEPVEESVVVSAFTTAHSSAEVYRDEAIRAVFGTGKLEPETIAGLASAMRANLAGVWRSQKTQQEQKTNRKAADVRREVLRGYAIAKGFLEDALAKHPDEWRLAHAAAALAHDENDYLNEIEYDSEYAPRRKAAITDLARAAELYAGGVSELRENEETIEPFATWFYASLGACDLHRVAEGATVLPGQTDQIRAAIDAIGGEAAERHLERFASQLFARMSSVKPEVKFRYLEAGFEIVGDHEAAAEAKEVLDYYADLVTEIELVTRLDGDSVVGHGDPFGVFVSLRHTREIERESGGFGKYLQNQNSGTRYYFNYGRPLANYRDRFEESVLKLLDEQFEVLSVTFEEPNVNSLALGRYGWRETPYAYLLLKATGPDVDLLPPLEMDLDFLDTSGYAVIPVESEPLAVDCLPETGRPRPVAELDVVQTLDERQAGDGKLLLEIEATGRGLVGPLEGFLDLDPADFEVVAVEDGGLAVSRFDDEAEGVAVVSERSWTVELAAKSGLEGSPETFAFAKPTVEVAEVSYQRYVDADLLPVERVVSLEEQYARVPWWLVAGGVLLAALPTAVIGRQLTRRRVADEAESADALPDDLTPFQAVTYLRGMRAACDGDAEVRADLDAEIARLERTHFGGVGEEPIGDLGGVVGGWRNRLNGALSGERV